MKKGFTLIELIAIIAIIAVVSIMSFAVITNTIKKNELRKWEIFEDTLIQAAKLCIETNRENVEICGSISTAVFEESGDIMYSTQLKLKQLEYLDNNMRDPDGNISNNLVVKAVIEADYSIKYSVEKE